MKNRKNNLKKQLLDAAPFPKPANGFIENQFEWKSIRYGWHPKSVLSETGCGIFAVWNILCAAGRIREESAADVLAGLISDFERFGAVFGGRLGISVAAIYIYLKRNFRKAGLCIRHNAFAQNTFGIKYDAIAATVLNDRKHPLKGMHTVCITKSKRGFVIHNAYRKDVKGQWRESEAYPVLSEALSHISSNPFFVVMTGVKF